VGYAAFRARGTVGLLVDLFTGPTDRETFHALVAGVVRHFRATEVNVVRTLAARGSAQYRAFRRYGFFRSPHAFGVHALSLDASLEGASLRDPATWCMAGGDFDVV
jgi:hypothetical protein